MAPANWNILWLRELENMELSYDLQQERSGKGNSSTRDTALSGPWRRWSMERWASNHREL
jgi:hypothetical protein